MANSIYNSLLSVLIKGGVTDNEAKMYLNRLLESKKISENSLSVSHVSILQSNIEGIVRLRGKKDRLDHVKNLFAQIK